MAQARDLDVPFFPATIISREGLLYTIAPVISLTTQYSNVPSQFGQEFSRGDRVSVQRLENNDGKLLITGPLSSGTELALFGTSQVQILLNGVPPQGTYQLLRNGFEIQSGLIPVGTVRFVADEAGIYTLLAEADTGETGSLTFFLDVGQATNAILLLEIIETCTTRFRNLITSDRSPAVFFGDLTATTIDPTPLP